MYLAEIDGLFVDNIFYTRHSLLEIDVSKPTKVGQPRYVEGTSFFSGSKPKGSMLVKNVVKHNKIVTSDVDITVVLIVKVKIKKSSVKIFQKRWQIKIF